MTSDGVIVITAARFRSQERNRADAVERLVELIRRAAVAPRRRRADQAHRRPRDAARLRPRPARRGQEPCADAPRSTTSHARTARV